MPDFNLVARPVCTPETNGQIGDYVVRETPLAIVSVATFERGDGAAMLSRYLKFAAPEVAKWNGNGALSAFWTSPGQWFVTSAERENATLFNDLSEALGTEAALTDQTGGWTCFDVTGPNLTSVLEKLVGFDIAGADAGDAQRTSIEHISSFVLCSSREAVRVLCPRSYARSLHHALSQAIRSQLALENLPL